jgi:cell division protein FtsL
MSQAQTQNIKNGLITLRKGNRKAKVSEWAQGGKMIPIFAATAMFVAFALLFVWSNHQSVQIGYVISGLHQEKSHLRDLSRKYKVELANLTALDRLEHLAKNNLGLVAPSPEQVQVIE